LEVSPKVRICLLFAGEAKVAYALCSLVPFSNFFSKRQIITHPVEAFKDEILQAK